MSQQHSVASFSYEAQAQAVRRDIIDMIYRAGMGHPGSSLSCVELLVALYLGKVIQVDPANPQWPDRDRFVLSKGHASPTLYSVLSRCGFFPRETLNTFRQTGSILTAYPDMSTPGVDMESGSLGNGISTAVGMALSAKLRHQEHWVYTILGDGELQEGIVWEAAMCAAHHKLDHLIAMVDRNRLQITGTVEEVMNISPLEDKWRSFGWNVLTIDGHSFPQIFDALEQAKTHRGAPTVIIADTIKGKGVSYMENVLIWHRNVISDAQYQQAIAEIDAPEELL
jgi:transketolase